MTVLLRRFDSAKALEAILFIAEGIPHPSLHSVSKILYLADRIHLERYGRLICGDEYVAMRHGPVPSGIYDMMKAARSGAALPGDLAEKVEVAFDVVNRYEIQPKRQADQQRLSLSEVECLTESMRDHGQKSFAELTRLTHDQAWKSADENDLIPIEQIANTLRNADDVLSYLRG